MLLAPQNSSPRILNMGDYRYVNTYEDRHGKTRRDFRKPGLPRRALYGEPNTSEFNRQYDDALRGVPLPRRPKRGRPEPGAKTLRACWRIVLNSTEWSELRPSTQKVQERVAENFFAKTIPGRNVKCGELKIDEMKRKHVKEALGLYRHIPHAGDGVYRLLQKLSTVALDQEWIESDPTYKIKYSPKLKGHRKWTTEERKQYEAFWSDDTTQRLAYELARYTTQRRADLAAMKLEHYDGQGITTIQQKTGTIIWNALPKKVRDKLDKLTGEFIIQTSRGAGYATESFGNFMAGSIRQAGLPDDCTLHGLRKTGLTELADLSQSENRLKAVGGHKTTGELQKYVADANQRLLAQQAMDVWEEAETGEKPKLRVVK